MGEAIISLPLVNLNLGIFTAAFIRHAVVDVVDVTGESAEVPPRGGAIILARLRSEGGQVKSFSFFHWCVRGGGRLEVSLRDSKEEDPP
jgi:hypothetical protein